MSNYSKFYKSIKVPHLLLIGLLIIPLLVGSFSNLNFQVKASGTPAIEQQMNIIDSNITSAGAGKGQIYIDPADYSGTVTYYFEVDAKVTSGTGVVTFTYGAGTGSAISGGTDLNVNITSTSYSRVRTQFTPTAGNAYVKTITGTGTTVNAARVIILQSDSTSINNTETQFEVGHTALAQTATTDSVLSSPKMWKYDSSKYDGTVAIYFEAAMSISNAAETGTATLYEAGSSCSTPVGGIVSVAVTGTTATRRIRSADISGSLTTGTTYMVCTRSSNASASMFLNNAKVIIKQTSTNGLSKMRVYQQFINFPSTNTTTALSGKSFFNTYESANWSGGTFTYSTSGTLKSSIGTDTVTAQLCYQTTTACDTAVANTALTTANTSYTYVENTTTFTPPNGVELDAGLKVTTGGHTASATDVELVIDVTSLPVYTPPVPTAVTVTVDPATPTIVSKFNNGFSQIDNTLRYPWTGNDQTAVNNAITLATNGVHYMYQPIFEWGVSDPWNDPSQSEPTNWGGLDAQMSVVQTIGATKVLTLAEAPWWMKGTLRSDGTTSLIPDVSGEDLTHTYASGITDYRGITYAPGYVSPDPYSARILDNQMSKWLLLVQRAAERYMVAPYNVRYFQVWNELKGYYNGAVNHWDYLNDPGDPSGYNAKHGYTYMYNQVYNTLMSVADELGISRSDVYVGGPYSTINTWTSTSAGGFPTTEAPLQSKAYGTFDQRDLDVIKYWLANKVGAGFITVDGSNSNREGTTLTDPFTSTQKFSDLHNWIRSLNNTTYPGAATLPIWWAEWNAIPETGMTSDYNNAVKAEGLKNFINSGASVPILWGGQGEASPGQGLWTPTTTGGGIATPFYTTFKTLNDSFGNGTQLYSDSVSDSSLISALSTASKTMLINKSGTLTLSATINGGAPITLTPYQVAFVNYSVSDVIAPTVPGTPSTTTPTSDTTPTWTWTASTDSNSGLANPAYTVQWSQDSSFNSGVSSSTSNTNSFTHSTPLADGTWYFRVKATDVATNASAYSSNGSAAIDSTVPTGTISINSGASSTNSTSATLTLTTSDNIDSSSSIQMEVSNASDFSGAVYESFAASKAWTLISGEGTKTVYVKFKDSTGNESIAYSDTIILDTTAPTGSISINSGAANTNSTSSTLTISASDNLTTVSQMEISEDSGFAGASYESYATSKAFTLTSSEGTKTVYIRFKDGTGNVSATYSDTITLDTTAPSGSFVINAGDSVTASTSVTLTINATDNLTTTAQMEISEDSGFSGASFEAYATSKAFTISSGDGVKTIYMRFKDGAGNTSGSISDTITLDTSTPSGTVIINNNDAYTNSTNVTLTIDASGSGVSSVTQMEVSEDSGFAGASYEAYATSKNFTLSSTQGSKTVYVKFKNNVGTESGAVSDNITLDTSVPTGSVLINSGNSVTTSTSVSLTINSSDTFSFVSQMEVSNDAAFTGASFEAFATTKSFSLTSVDGTKTVYIRFKDGAGNISGAVSDTIILDTTAPSGSIVINSNATVTGSTSVTLTINATDALSTVSQMEISESSLFTGATFENYATTKAFSLSSGDGSKTVYIRFKDSVGNTSAGISNSITLDTTAPTGSININAGNSITASTAVTLSINATDTLSSVTQMEISEDPGFSGAAYESYATSKNFSLSSGDGTKTVYIRFKDTPGNVSTSYSDSIILDTTIPTGSIIINNNDLYTNNPNVTLALDATGSPSTVNQMIISEDSNFAGATYEPYNTSKSFTLSSTDGNKTVYVKFKNISSVESVVYSDNIALDTTAPTGSISINAGAAQTTSYNVTLTINATDATSFVDKMEVSEYIGFDDATWQNFATSQSFTLANGEGNKAIYVRFRDIVGNVSGIYFDEIVKTTQSTSENSTTTTTTPTVTITIPPTNQSGDKSNTTVVLKLVDQNGNPLVGAKVTIAELNIQGITDQNGLLNLGNVAAKNYDATIEYNGIISTEVLGVSTKNSTVTLSINVPATPISGSIPTDSSSISPVIIIGGLVAVTATAGLIILRRRRS